ncbi:Ubiquitin-conjugating enzyme E2 N [Tritrichomonas foetus]|uniref:Ubiquitin-conjugating enzyme E2 N n=1 Tax=Tritrichomonas foetus TaxID=1144522 RepID=A0A1J4L0D3_9EUKA|nr:Ubiquitin-conjugating enzyme E2 N [Tritrichomonas foetus]|eukprot:OHT15309.1 Ubiquitin-conjugating enzyme E2 N [Tritrichomonas foetus]
MKFYIQYLFGLFIILSHFFNDFKKSQKMSAEKRRARLMKERRQLLLDPIENVNVMWPDNCIDRLHVEITAPEDSLYHDDIFELDLTFNNGYPENAPRAVMTTPIFHPNIDVSGAICVACLRTSYNQTVSVRKVIEEIIHALRNPNPDDELNMTAASMMKTDPKKFEATVRAQVTKNCLQRDA